MKIIWTGTFPVFSAVLVFAAAAWWTWRLYGRQGLPAPWSVLLPAARTLALLLLCLALLQPVLVRNVTVTRRGVIPVIADNSGSMSASDSYEPAEAVQTAWHLGLIPRESRCSLFGELALSWEREEEAVSALLKAAEAALPALAGGWSEAAAKAVSVLRQRLVATAAGFGEIEKRVDGAVLAHPYLLAASSEQGTELCARLSEDRELLARNRVLGGELAGEIGAAEKARDAAAARAAADLVRGLCRDYGFLRASMDSLQNLSDARLAGEKAVAPVLDGMRRLRRIDYLKRLLSDEGHGLGRRLAEKGDLEVYTLDAQAGALPSWRCAELEANLSSSRLGSAVREALRSVEGRPVCAVLLFSDGRCNAGLSPAEAKRMLADRGVPLFAFGMGSAVPGADLALEHVGSAKNSFAGDTIRLGVSLLRRGFENQPVRLTVSEGGRLLGEKTVEPGGEARTAAELAFQENRSGTWRYVVEAELLPGEALKDNNRLETSVTVLRDRVRVLLVDEFPRWESRFVAMMLSRDRRAESKVIFASSLEPGKPGPGPGGYPSTREELFAYHAVILGDLDPRRFAPRQLEDLRAFVVERGGALVLMAGERYMPARYESGPLGAILPVGCDWGRGEEPALPRPADVKLRLEAAEACLFDDLLAIGDSPEQSRELWRRLPELNWAHGAVMPTRASERLVSTESNGLPVLVKGSAGLGRVLYLGSDSFWRWRYLAGWKYHHRLWSQILLWATADSLAGNNPRIKFAADRASYAPEEAVRLRARVLLPDGGPMAGATVSAEISAEKDGFSRSVQLLPVDGALGEYGAELRSLPVGRYSARPRVMELPESGAEPSRAFEVRDQPTGEYTELSLDEEQLRSIATDYRPFHRMDELLSRVPKSERSETIRSESELWSRFPLLAVLAALLGFEWHMRRRLNAV